MSIIKIPTTLQNITPFKIKIEIPKIIHQTYISYDTIPVHWKDTPDTWRIHHPDWTYMFWSDESCRKLVQSDFSWFLSTFDGYEYAIQRADAIRYMIMYKYGGLYADLDIQAIKPFDDLFYKYADFHLINTSNMSDMITNCILASNPKIEFWIDVLKDMKNRFENPNNLWIGKHIKVMYTTGPAMLNSLFIKHKNNYKYGILPQNFLLPISCNSCCEKPCSSDLSYTKLLDGSSWVNYDTRIYTFLNCHYEYILILIGIIYVLYTVLNITYNYNS